MAYSGDPLTRPMKDRVREAVFNLIGPAVIGSHVVDLFAGTGALALEGLSRQAVSALAIERHFPTARLIADNARNLGLTDRVEVFAGDTFIWSRRVESLGDKPCTIFCCPPYSFYQQRWDDLSQLIQRLLSMAPLQSRFIVEADSGMDWQRLRNPELWDVRTYSPAVVGMFIKTDEIQPVDTSANS